MHPAVPLIAPLLSPSSELQHASSSTPSPTVALGHGPCQHLSLPSPRDIDNPSSLSDDNKSFFNLECRRYDLKQLVPWTRKCWDATGYRSYRTRNKLKLSIISQLAPILPVRYPAPTGTPKWKDTLENRRFIDKLFRDFDAYFFFGTLSRCHSGNTVPLVQVVLQSCKNSPENPLYGYTEVESVMCASQIATSPAHITLCPEHPQLNRQYLYDVVETLLHEMIHAYIEIFACNSNSCEAAHSYYYGKTGHATVFSLLQMSLTQRIRGMEKCLKSFMSHNESDFVHFISLKQEAKAWETGEYPMPRVSEWPELAKERRALARVLQKHGLVENKKNKKKPVPKPVKGVGKRANKPRPGFPAIYRRRRGGHRLRARWYRTERWLLIAVGMLESLQGLVLG